MKNNIPIEDLMGSFHTDEKNKVEDIVSSYTIVLQSLRNRLKKLNLKR